MRASYRVGVTRSLEFPFHPCNDLQRSAGDSSQSAVPSLLDSTGQRESTTELDDRSGGAAASHTGYSSLIGDLARKFDCQDLTGRIPVYAFARFDPSASVLHGCHSLSLLVVENHLLMESSNTEKSVVCLVSCSGGEQMIQHAVQIRRKTLYDGLV